MCFRQEFKTKNLGELMNRQKKGRSKQCRSKMFQKWIKLISNQYIKWASKNLSKYKNKL